MRLYMHLKKCAELKQTCKEFWGPTINGISDDFIAEYSESTESGEQYRRVHKVTPVSETSRPQIWRRFQEF